MSISLSAGIHNMQPRTTICTSVISPEILHFVSNHQVGSIDWFIYHNILNEKVSFLKTDCCSQKDADKTKLLSEIDCSFSVVFIIEKINQENFHIFYYRNGHRP
jgi:hypothetical protein